MNTKLKYLGLLAILPLLTLALTIDYTIEADAATKSKGTKLLQVGSTNSPVCGDKLCSEGTMEEETAEEPVTEPPVTEESVTELPIIEEMAKETDMTLETAEEPMMEKMQGKYTYTQEFLPVKKMEIDLARTAVFITDPQNDFISEGGAAWEGVGEQVIADKVVEHQVMLRDAAKEVGIPVFYSPHTYTEMDYANWKLLNPIDQLMFDVDMFHEGTWGHDFHPDMMPDDNTIVMNPHKGLSNFHAGDAKMQLRQYGIDTLIMAGMSANLCVESHLRDAIENGFEVIVIADATAGFGPHAKNAALINFEFIANEVTTTDDIISRLRQAANS